MCLPIFSGSECTGGADTTKHRMICVLLTSHYGHPIWRNDFCALFTCGVFLAACTFADAVQEAAAAGQGGAHHVDR